jgi:hypothetical protein
VFEQQGVDELQSAWQAAAQQEQQVARLINKASLPGERPAFLLVTFF